MFDCCESPEFKKLLVGWEMVLTGTGISVPEAMIAFLLLLVKTVGREIVLNLPVESSRRTMAANELPAAR